MKFNENESTKFNIIKLINIIIQKNDLERKKSSFKKKAIDR